MHRIVALVALFALHSFAHAASPLFGQGFGVAPIPDGGTTSRTVGIVNPHD